ncbi:hypothetical protein HanIR_Chr07g0328611 [Helianthus annuus]|nr:hypothetical protein HanIR_Chr07g0328611 [Helianthus annuus]
MKVDLQNDPTIFNVCLQDKIVSLFKIFKIDGLKNVLFKFKLYAMINKTIYDITSVGFSTDFAYPILLRCCNFSPLNLVVSKFYKLTNLVHKLLFRLQVSNIPNLPLHHI